MTRFLHRMLPVFLLLTAILIVQGFSLANAQGTGSERYRCPQQNKFRSDVPFTREALEAILGFSDPALNDVMNIATDFFDVKSYDLNVSCTPQNDATFVAVLYYTNLGKMRLWVFSLHGMTVMSETHLDTATTWMPDCLSVSKAADRNFNGLPDLFMSGCDGGTKGWNSGLRIIELGGDGLLRDITPVGGDTGPDSFDDIDGDGIPEIYDAQYFFMPTFPFYSAAVQRLDQWWTWNSLGARTTAVQVQAFSDDGHAPMTAGLDSGKRIEAYLSGFSDAQICADVEKETEQDEGELRWNLFQILMYYHAWGDLDAGWARIHPILLTADQCADSVGKRVFFGALGEFEAYFDTL